MNINKLIYKLKMSSTEIKKTLKLNESIIFQNLLIQLHNKINKNASNIDYKMFVKLISALGVNDNFQDFTNYLSTKFNISKDKLI